MKFLKKIQDLYRDDTIRNGSLFSLFSFVNKGVSFLLLLVLANFIVPAEYGYLNLFNTVVMVVGYFIAMSSEGYLSVSYFKDGPDSVKQCVSSSLLTMLFVVMLFAMMLFTGGELISSALRVPLPLLCLAILICFCSVLSRIAMNYYRIRKQIWMYGLMSCGSAVLYFVLSIVFVKFLNAGWQGCVWAQFGSFFIFGAAALILFFRNGFVCVPSIEFWKKMLLWGIPLIPHLATNFIRQGCDRYIIDYFHGIDEVGLFCFALNLANVIIMIGMGFNDSNSVELFGVLGNKSLDKDCKIFFIKKQRRTIFFVYLFASLSVVLFFVFFIPIALSKYEASISYFLILSIYGFFHCLYFLYTNFLFYYKKTKTLMYVTFSSALLHLALSLIFTRYSLIATSVVYCLTQLIVVLFVRYYANRLVQRDLC